MKWKYEEISDVADLSWLLVEERIDFAIMTFAFKGLN